MSLAATELAIVLPTDDDDNNNIKLSTDEQQQDNDGKGFRGRFGRLRNRQKKRQEQWLDNETTMNACFVVVNDTCMYSKYEEDIDRCSTARTSSSSIFQNVIDEMGTVDNQGIDDKKGDITRTTGNTPLLLFDHVQQNLQKVKKNVRWGIVEIRIYEIILGDNPSVTNGPPISLGWMYNNCSTIHELHALRSICGGGSSHGSHTSNNNDEHVYDADQRIGRMVEGTISSITSSTSNSFTNPNDAISIDEYESIRRRQRHIYIEELIIPTWEREQCLMEYNSYTRSELNKVITNITEIKVSRQNNAKLGFFEKGGFTSLLQKRLLQKKKHKLHSNYF